MNSEPCATFIRFLFFPIIVWARTLPAYFAQLRLVISPAIYKCISNIMDALINIDMLSVFECAVNIMTILIIVDTFIVITSAMDVIMIDIVTINRNSIISTTNVLIA